MDPMGNGSVPCAFLSRRSRMDDGSKEIDENAVEASSGSDWIEVEL